MASCDACATAERYPHLYRRDCMRCLARQVADVPESTRSALIFRIEAGLEPAQLEEFRKARDGG
jgi:hypothetical protein